MLLTLILSTLAFAGDASTYQNLGFSPNGQYFAFAQVGSQDGSGFPYAEANVVNVADNKIVARKYVLLSSDGDEVTGTEKEALAEAIKQVNLSRFNITEGKNLGKDLVARLPTDLAAAGKILFSTDYWPQGGVSGSLPKYEVVLNEKMAEDRSEGRWCTGFGGPKMFKLSLVGRDATDGRTTVLQNDNSLPRSRGECVLGYRTSRVTTYKGGLVVQLTYTGPGFEGPDERQMVVTGKVDI